MSITTKMNGWIAFAALFAAVALASSSAQAIISAPGDPAFLNSFKLKANKGKWTVTAKDGFTFFKDGQGYLGTNGNYKLTATFDNGGNLTGGSLTFKGALPDFGITKNNTVLLTADIDEFNFNSSTVASFGTVNLAGEICVVLSCTSGPGGESVWLYFDAAVIEDVNVMQRAEGDMLTTIPLPAAAWLFGSGLIAMGTIARRKKIKAAGCLSRYRQAF